MGPCGSRGNPPPFLQPGTRDWPRRHSQSLHLARGLRCPPHDVREHLFYGAPVSTAATRRVPVRSTGHLLCRRPPVLSGPHWKGYNAPRTWSLPTPWSSTSRSLRTNCGRSISGAWPLHRRTPSISWCTPLAGSPSPST